MNRSGFKYRLYFAVFAVSALWLSVGSLVHFHQYKIYGKPLLSDVVISKRENEVIAKILDLNKSSRNHDDGLQNYPDQLFGCHSVDSALPLLVTWTAVPWFEQPWEEFQADTGTGLRAPPLA